MRVMVFVKATQHSEAGALPSEALLTEMGKYNDELIAAGVLLAAGGLHPSSKGKRVRIAAEGERTVMDGPFPGTNDLISGYWLWEVKSIEDAVQWVKRCPNPTPGEGSEVEIRPLFEAEDFGENLAPELKEQEDRQRAHLERQVA